MRRVSAIAVGLVLLLAAGHVWAAPSQGMPLFGDLKYGPGFTHFDYVNPQAPKGGTMRYSAIGTFDTLNPFV
ncbi:MAG: ABC transporter substrate-binding protein, partial [Stellaceae bacterium]